MSRRVVLAYFVLLCTASATFSQTADRITISYGSHPTSFGELQLPSGDGPFPVVVLIHGGCYRSDLGSTKGYRPMAEALERNGIATWNVEYRRVGHAGGGWPGTYQDLGLAIDFLQVIAESYPVDINRAVVLGHSSGGSFAAWLAARPLLPVTSEIRGDPKVHLAGVVISDSAIDPVVLDSRGVDGELLCGERVLERLIGGTRDSHPDRLRQISSIDWLPWGVPQEYIVSSEFYPVTPNRTYFNGRITARLRDYPLIAGAAGDTINVDVIDGADHFDFYKPDTEAFEAIKGAVLRSLDNAGHSEQSDQM